MEVNGQLQAPTALLPGKEPPASTGQESRWAPEPVWTRCQEKNSQFPPGIRTSIIRSYRLSYTGSVSKRSEIQSNENYVFHSGVLISWII
jgi:hypothetical protein